MSWHGIEWGQWNELEVGVGGMRLIDLRCGELGWNGVG
jgi:hypothetical protein